MKHRRILVLLFLTVGFTGCRGLGYNDQSSYNNMTPSVQEKQYVRTYPNGTQGPPVVTEQQPNAANDPAYPK